MLAVLTLSIVERFLAGTVLTRRRILYTTSVVAVAPILLLALHTIGQLGIRDLVLVLVFTTAMCFYISQRV